MLSFTVTPTWEGLLRGFAGKISGAVMVRNMELEIAVEGRVGNKSCGFCLRRTGWYHLLARKAYVTASDFKNETLVT
jgi:hypothetical protein